MHKMRKPKSIERNYDCTSCKQVLKAEYKNRIKKLKCNLKCNSHLLIKL